MTLLGCAATAGAADPSATLRQPQGQVLVGQTSAMGQARDGMPLFEGNRVVTTGRSGARIVYADGCTVVLSENSLLEIAGADQCRAGLALVQSSPGVPLASTQATALAGAPALALTGAQMTALGVGTVLGVAAVGAYQVNHSNDDNLLITSENPAISR
jgi:hypothetical protein